jgi:hypothetical protein
MAAEPVTPEERDPMDDQDIPASVDDELEEENPLESPGNPEPDTKELR